MACCMTTPCHYLKKCWLIISQVQQQSLKGNFAQCTLTINHLTNLEHYISELSSIPSCQPVDLFRASRILTVFLWFQSLTDALLFHYCLKYHFILNHPVKRLDQYLRHLGWNLVLWCTWLLCCYVDAIAPCGRNPSINGGSSAPVKEKIEVVSVARLDTLLCKQWSCKWFETPSHPCNVTNSMATYVPAHGAIDQLG